MSTPSTHREYSRGRCSRRRCAAATGALAVQNANLKAENAQLVAALAAEKARLVALCGQCVFSEYPGEYSEYRV